MGELTSAEAHAASQTVKRELRWAAKNIHGQAKPKAILLAGQPGAGKTVLTSLGKSYIVSVKHRGEQ